MILQVPKRNCVDETDVLCQELFLRSFPPPKPELAGRAALDVFRAEGRRDPQGGKEWQNKRGFTNQKGWYSQNCNIRWLLFNLFWEVPCQFLCTAYGCLTVSFRTHEKWGDSFPEMGTVDSF